MAFVPREAGRISRIPTESRFGVAAYEKKTATECVYWWLTMHWYIATPEERKEVNRIVEAAGEKPSVLMALLKTLLEGHPTEFTRALAAKFF